MANVALHAANAWLVGMIVAHMVTHRRWWTALAAASLFALFPFGFQAVLPVSSLMHPAHVAAVLACVLAFMAYARSGRILWLALAAMMVAAAIFSHENGALAPALAVLTAACRPGPRPWRRIGIGALVVGAAALICLLAWAAVPRGTAPLSLAGVFERPTDRLQNAALFLQGLAFPVSMLARPLQSILSIQNYLLAIALVSIPAVLAWWALAGWRLQPAWALAWYALAALPAVALLGFSYVLESPRLMYLAAAGAAAFWAMPLGFGSLNVGADGALTRARIAAVSILTIAACVWGFAYVQRRVALYQAMGRSIAQVSAAAEDRACAGARVATVNFPAWYFVRDAEYVLGHDGITSLSEGGRLSDLMQLNSAWRGEASEATLPDVLSVDSAFVPLGEARAHDALAPVLRDSGAVIVNDSASRLGDFGLAGCRLAKTDDAVSRATFAGGPVLRSASIEASPDDGRVARVILDWDMRLPITDDVTVFVHVVDAAGSLVAQADGYPLRGASPMRTWQPGDSWRDIRTIRLRPDAPPGDYAVLAGVYRTADGARLAATSAAGQPLRDNAVPVGIWRIP